jgi:ribosomal protein L31
MKNPIDIHAHSHKRVAWVCDCGATVELSVAQVTSGKSSSCGKCRLISAAKAASMKFGSLRLKFPISLSRGSHVKTVWVCDCGKETTAEIGNVVRGLTKSCGKCSVLTADHFEKEKYGKLKMKLPADFHPNSEQETIWVCDCGNEFRTRVGYVVSGQTKSCGWCNAVNAEPAAKCGKLKALRPPVLQNQIALEPFLNTGCCTHRVSRGQSELAEFIRSLSVDATVEHRVGGLSYDVALKSYNILIEYNGLKWHQGPNGQRRDTIKYRNALSHGWQFISIFEDEWIRQRPKVESMIKNKLGLCKPKTSRPSKCDIDLVPAREADEFYEKFHYIGRAKAPINYAVRFDNNMVACMSFKRPTRQSKHSWELVRMASHTDVRIHGIWSKLFRDFVRTKNPDSIVSFSDNRLFNGSVYEHLGFKLDGEIPADYYWCKSQRRWHKSGLRKTLKERDSGLTEFELRTKQGYFRVWDVGKKRWVWSKSS